MVQSTGLRMLLMAMLGLSVARSVFGWGFPYGEQKVRGVNLGGWLVLEVGVCAFLRVLKPSFTSTSLGSPRLFLTTQEMIALLTSGPLVNTRIEGRLVESSRSTGTRGLRKMTSERLLMLGMPYLELLDCKFSDPSSIGT